MPNVSGSADHVSPNNLWHDTHPGQGKVYRQRIKPVVLCDGTGRVVESKAWDRKESPQCPACGGLVYPGESPYTTIPPHLPVNTA